MERKNKVQKIDRAQQVFDLLNSGMSYRAVANQLGISLATVQRDIAKYEAEEISPKADELRKRQLAQVQAGKRAVWKRYTEGDDKAVTSMIRLMEREAKLLGLDSATAYKVETVSNRETDRLEVLRMMEQMFGPAPAELPAQTDD